jgi:parallel beta-helix repeat protein
VFEKLVDGQALIEISYNNIVADQDGVLFQGETRNALLPGGASQQEIFINENTITGGNNGIRFAQNVATDLHDIRITGNTIDGQNVHGISFDGNIGAESQVWILNNDSIVGDDDGIHVHGTVSSSALVEIVDNTWIEGEDDDGIDFNSDISGNAVVRINGNDNIRADDNADNGIEFAGVSGNAKVEILGNNHGIHADGHGIYFGGNISGNADLDIHDNIINADDNNSGNGDGIRFDGFVSGNSTINIGDGNGLNFSSDPSNIISGEDGIHFNNDIYNSAQIVIDGNRIGYDGATLAGPYSNDRVGDDGIEFADRIYDDANITISDNFIRSEDDGVHFDGDVYGRANILIGGSGDKNTIDANGDGIEFDEDIYQNALINISHNVVDAELDGVRFEGSTSNADTTFPYRDDEILIAYNSIEAGDNGINFLGQASGNRHDIMIRNNTQIHGHDGHGIAHTGGISDAELRILNNDDIFGDIDGIHITGAFTNDALIDIDGNTDIDTNDGDGIEVTQSGGGGGVDLNITRNHIHYVGDNGIEVTNVDGVFIGFNDIHDTDNNGIYVDNSEDAQIRWNDLWAIDEDGIYVEDSESVNIEDNDLWGIGDDGIDVSDSHFAEIEDNDIFFTGGDGIQVRDSSLVQIDDNFIRFAGDDGIDLENSFFSSITDNNVRFTDENGIEVNDSYFILIDENEVADADEAGIFIDPSAVIFVTNNNVHDNDIGLYVQGPNNGYINVTGNTFTDNRVGARFESGIIDLTGISSDPSFGGFGNKFIGGDIGLEFDAWGGRTTQLSLVRTGGILSNGYTYDGLGYDTFDGSTVFPPVNFGGTIGEQYFEGQSQHFVAVRSNTFIDPKTRNAIWLDGQDSTYFFPAEGGAFKPSVDGVTVERLAFLEDMFRHWPDANNRGIFFFGLVPEVDTLGLENVEDFFNDFDPFNTNISGLNLTITGLPSIGAPGGYGLNLNNITPFAGGPEDVANIEPAAGDEIQTTAEVQDIEPAAGGEDAACWGQVLNAAVNGAVNYDFTSSPEETLNDSTACGGGTL